MIEHFCKELEEFNDYLIEYLEKSGVHFYSSFLKLGVFQQSSDDIQVIANRIKSSIKKELK